MQALGFTTCDVAANGQDAFLKVMEDAPDIVLMDVNLEGGREGIEAARWLREVCDIPVVFVTAYTDPDTIERIHEQVPDAPVIAKPLYRDRLARCKGSRGVLIAVAGGCRLSVTLAGRSFMSSRAFAIRLNGTVKFRNYTRGFGFIAPENGD
jgi:CheY-like chemotaxis protein